MAMQQIIQLAAIFAGLYLIYALTLKKWDYVTEAQKADTRNRLKECGLSDRYYFTGPGKLFALGVLSGGLFLFYWFYKQWQAIRGGYKRKNGAPLTYPPALRALLGFISIFQLLSIINRTAQYLRQPASFPAAFWGTLFALCAAGIWAAHGPAAKTTSFLVLVCVPGVIQARINLLAGQTPSNKPKGFELVITALGAVLTVICIVLLSK